MFLRKKFRKAKSIFQILRLPTQYLRAVRVLSGVANLASSEYDCSNLFVFEIDDFCGFSRYFLRKFKFEVSQNLYLGTTRVVSAVASFAF